MQNIKLISSLNTNHITEHYWSQKYKINKIRYMKYNHIWRVTQDFWESPFMFFGINYSLYFQKLSIGNVLQ